MVTLASRIWEWESRGVELDVTREPGCSPEAVLGVCHADRLTRAERAYLTRHRDEATWLVALWQQALETVQ